MKYEMKSGETVATLLSYAGGFTGDEVLFSQRQKVVLTLAIRSVMPCTSFSYVLLRLRLLSALQTAPHLP